MGVLTDINASTDYTEEVIASDGLSVFELCPADSRRYMVAFAATPGFNPTVTTNADPNNASGIVLPQTGVVEIKVKDWGALAQQAWYMTPVKGPQSVTVFQVYFPNE